MRWQLQLAPENIKFYICLLDIRDIYLLLMYSFLYRSKQCPLLASPTLPPAEGRPEPLENTVSQWEYHGSLWNTSKTLVNSLNMFYSDCFPYSWLLVEPNDSIWILNTHLKATFSGQGPTITWFGLYRASFCLSLCFKDWGKLEDRC